RISNWERIGTAHWNPAGSEALLTDLDPVHVIGLKFRPDGLSFQLPGASLANHRQVVYRCARIQLDEAELAALAFGKTDDRLDHFARAGRGKIPKYNMIPASVSRGKGFHVRAAPAHSELLSFDQTEQAKGVVGRSHAALVVPESVILRHDVPPVRHEVCPLRRHPRRKSRRVHEKVPDMVIGRAREA